jgi:hypothetical protein
MMPVCVSLSVGLIFLRYKLFNQRTVKTERRFKIYAFRDYPNLIIFYFIQSVPWSHGSSADLVTRLRIVHRGIVVEILANDKKYHSSSECPYQFCGHVTFNSVDTGSDFACVKRLRPDTHYIPPSRSEVKNDWSYISASPICLHVAYNYKFTFTLQSLIAVWQIHSWSETVASVT